MNKEKAEKETRYVTVDSREEKDEVKPRKDLAIDNEYETKTVVSTAVATPP